MITIEIDNQTYSFLQAQAIPFVEKPGDTIKRLLGIKNDTNNLSISSTKNIVKDIEINKYTNKKKPKTNLQALITAGLLRIGQNLIFQDYRGNKYLQYKVSLNSNGLIWNNKLYSMSDLAQLLLKQHGYETNNVRGPIFWFNEQGNSIADLWKKYLNKDYEEKINAKSIDNLSKENSSTLSQTLSKPSLQKNHIFSFKYKANLISSDKATDFMKSLIVYLATLDNSFMARLASVTATKDRRLIDKSRDNLFIRTPSLKDKNSSLLNNGWWINTNNSTQEKVEFVRKAIEIAKLNKNEYTLNMQS